LPKSWGEQNLEPVLPIQAKMTVKSENESYSTAEAKKGAN